MRGDYVRWFCSMKSEDIEIVGGKGLSLGLMHVSSLPVPDGFVVTTKAYSSFVQHNDLQPPIERFAHSVSPAAGPEADGETDRLAAKFMWCGMPAEIGAAIESAYMKLSDVTQAVVAVRSSAVAEDLAGASFAGQHDSYLNVQGSEAVLASVRKCWASLWSTRAVLYRARQGVPQANQKMAVVVQRMAPARMSGVAFTANPLTGERGEIVVNASTGLGESLVSGEVIPDTYVVDKASKSIQQYTGGTEPETPRESVGVLTARATAGRSAAQTVMRTHEIRLLTETVIRIEELFATPMDVEWTMSDGQLAIVQARPITALPPQPLRWDAPGAGVWVHGGGIMEFQIEPISPLTASLIEGFFSTVYARMAPFIRTSASWPPVRVVNGHLYSCLTYRVRPWHIPSVARLVAQHLTSPSRWPAERDSYEAALRRVSSPPVAALSAEAIVARLEDILQAFFRYYFHYASMVQVLTNAEGKFNRFYERHVRSQGDPEPSLFLQGLSSRITESQESLRALSRQVAANAELKAFLDRNGTDWLDRETESQPIERFRRQVRSHIARFGYQMYALDFIVPTIGEQSDLLRSAIETAADAEPAATAERMGGQRQEALSILHERLGSRQWQRFTKLMERARNDLQTKEDAVFEIGRAIPVARAHFLELGRRLAETGVIAGSPDVFFMTWDEIAGVTGQLDRHEEIASLEDIILRRTEQQHMQKGLDAPAFLPVGSRPAWWLSRVMPLPESEDTPRGNVLKGVGVSPGVVTGTARVISDIRDIRRLEPGDILVTEATTPAWTPFFVRIRGLVTNRGGKLTHSSIVAREFGIPVVMGTVNATRRITDGQRITVDGNSGSIAMAPD
jgi:rifampicin phosphotransferase